MPELKNDRVEEVAEKLRGLGVPVELRDRPHPGAFEPGVWIDRGVLLACPWAAQPGGLFHEAGHLATIPSRFRPLIRPGPVFSPGCQVGTAIMEYARSEEAFRLGPDHWLLRACLNCGEHEAVAWSYAAALKVGFPPAEVFMFRYPGVPEEKQPFQGAGGDVLFGLEVGAAAGIHGLQHGGMCQKRRLDPKNTQPVWPEMIRWMQD